MRAALLFGLGGLCSGCVAAVVPVVASASIGASVRQNRHAARQAQATPVPASLPAPAPEPRVAVILPPGTALPPPDGVPVETRPAPAGMQYLYGSGEAAALSIQAYQALWTFIRVEIGYLRDKSRARSVVLPRGATLADPRFEPCGKRPLAVVLDIDETALLNLGYEADEAARALPYDQGRWNRWEATGADKVVAVPGAAEALDAIRRAGITVIFNSNRMVNHADATIAALRGAGLGEAALNDTLWLRGAGESGGKDARRWRIADRYCVVAMAGDQLGDFSDLFNAPDTPVAVRRNSAMETMVTQLWGAGWFMLPNPVYGTALKGTVGEVFPAERRWHDPGPPPPAAAVPKE
jgi:5'-nucleotidase (lipoprotein e(P4) family)